MVQFTYTARDSTGKIVSESINAASLNEAANILRAQKYQILTLKEKTQAQKTLATFAGRVSIVEKANLCRYLATMSKAGLPLADAVSAITRDTQNKTLKNILSEVQNDLQQGESLAGSFAKYPQIFDKVFVTIVAAGEKAGSLHQSFKYLQQQLLASHELSQKVKGALIYPAVIISSMIVVGAILLVFVIPQIAQVFLTSKFEVPQVTLMLLQAGVTLNQHLYLIGAMLGLAIVVVIFTLRTAKGKSVLIGFLKRLPVIHKLFEKLDLARFARTLATLMQSGVPVTQSLEVSTVTLSQKKFAPLANALKSDIKKGESISDILRTHHQHIPQMMISMVTTGEKTGTLDKILFDVAQFFEQELESEIKNFTAILEPVIMLFIGVGVGGMVLAVIAPIYSLVSSLQNLQ